ncbi:MAG: NAD-dependent epimerase/dehydratase family protein [Clostridiales bacterium]|nr:NAD-dependent epimerase/dehydratase family protein [Clostridiales bacterium]
MRNKRALIIGANGFVGPYLKKELASNGYEVYGCGYSQVGSAVEDNFFEVDITDYDAIYGLIFSVKPTHIFNLAAISSVGLSWEKPQATVNVNVCGTINILESVRKLGLNTKILLIGSSEEYAPSNKPVSENDKLDAVNPYGISRIMIEEFATMYRNRYGLDITCIRAFNHTGLGQTPVFVLPSFIEQVANIALSKECGKIKVGNISVYRDFSDVRDIVYAYRLIAESEEKICVINVGSGAAYKIEELLNYIISLSGKQIEVVLDKERFRPADLPYCCCDNTLLKSKTNWQPKYNIFDTLKEMYNNKIKNSSETAIIKN